MATIRLQRYLEFAEDYVLLDHGCYQHRPHGLYCDSRTQSSKTEKNFWDLWSIKRWEDGRIQASMSRGNSKVVFNLFSRIIQTCGNGSQRKKQQHFSGSRLPRATIWI